MKKRIVSILLVIIITIGLTFCLGGCSKKDDNFPVTIGHTKVSEKPKNVAVLSDNLADIILYMDEFESQICAVSDSCTQTELTKYLESVGPETNPSIDALVRSGAEYVLTDTPLSDTIKDKLSSNDITVLNFMIPETEEQLATVYNTLGTFFGGSPRGRQSAEAAYDRLFGTLNTALKETEGSNIIKVACYLYLNEQGQLCSYNNSDCYGMVLNYIGATNIAGNFNSEVVDTNILSLSKPDYIFFDNQEVLDFIRNHKELSKLSALKQNRTYLIPRENFERLGETLIETQRSMLSFIYDLNFTTTPDEANAESYADAYNINIDSDTIYKNSDDAEDIRIIQQRLMDLEYLILEDNTPTTYFGDKTEAAVREFQDANGLESTGIVNRTTLEKLFLSTTLSKSGNPVEPPRSVTTTTPSTESTDVPAVTQSSDYADKEYNIDLSEYKDYGVRDDGTRDVHEDIKAIQERLHDLGYLAPDESGYTDYYGPKTEEAFLRFETVNGLDENGFAGYDNLLLLFSKDALPNN